MAVNKNIILCILLVFSSSSFAISDEDKEVIKLSHQKMIEVEKELNKKIEYCEKIEQKILSDKTISTLEHINLSDADLKNSLFYFYNIAKQKCQTDELWTRLSARTAETKALEEYYKNEFVVLHESDLSNVCCIMPEVLLRSEINYFKIDSVKRAKLEKIDELKEQFDVIKTVKKMLNY